MAFPHEVIVELFRSRPELARELLQMCAGIDLGPGTAELGSIDLSQVTSIEFRADAVTVVRDAEHVATAAAIVEVQRGIDRDKELSWPVYVAALRASLRCPVTLLVLVPDQTIAAWARRRIELGHPGCHLRPIVLTYADAPRITDVAAAMRAPELAVLSALTHAGVDMAPAIAAAIGQLAEDPRELYSDLIMAAWPKAARKILEEHMNILKPEVWADIKALAYANGVEDGTDRGVEKGRIEALHTVAIELARTKITLSDADERSILAIADVARLNALIVALGCATESNARAELDRAILS